MKQSEDLVLLESNGPLVKYLDTKTNTVVYADAALEVPGVREIVKYKGIVTWTSDVTTQINALRKICKKYVDLPMKEILENARNNGSYEFGSFYKVEAADLLQSAKEYKLNMEMINVVSGEKLIL